MAHILVAVAVGVVAGVVAGVVPGGRRGVGPGRPLRWWPAVAGGVALQVAAVGLGLHGAPATTAVLASYGLLVAFATVNRRTTGMAFILCGLTLNLTSMVVNGGMPVRGAALVAAGLVDQAELAAVELGPKRHLEGPDDRLRFLGDVIPVRPLRQVLSVGDVVLAAGVALVAFRLVEPGGAGARRRRRPDAAGGVAGARSGTRR